MRPNSKILLPLVFLLLAGAAYAKRPIRFDDLIKIKRVSDPQISPDRKWVAFTVNEQSIEENNSTSHLWLVGFLGGEPKQLTRGSGSDSRPRWSPDSRSLAFISTRSGTPQIWRITVEGGEALQVTDFPTGAGGHIWSRRGNLLLFTSRVFPECQDTKCNEEKLAAKKENKVQASLFDRLLFRHWDHWREGRYAHLWVGSAEGGAVRDLTPGAFDSPTWSLGGMDGYDISPDGKEVCFTSNREAMTAVSTNNELYVVPVTGGEPRKISVSPGSDTAPRYSPDGGRIAYLSQQRGGFEADRERLMIYDRSTGKTSEIKTGMDISLSSFVWAPDGKAVYFTAQVRGRVPIFRLALDGEGTKEIVSGGTHGSLRVSIDGRTLAFARQSLNRPQSNFPRPR